MGNNLTEVTLEVVELGLEPKWALSKALDLPLSSALSLKFVSMSNPVVLNQGRFCSPQGVSQRLQTCWFSHQERGLLPASLGRRPGRLQSILQPTGQPLTMKIFQPPKYQSC